METAVWVMQPGTKQEVLNRFKHFLKTYIDNKGNTLYMDQLRRMCEGNLLVLI